MKRILFLLTVALMMAGSTEACVKKSRSVVTEPLTVIVTDTTRSLLAGAEIKVGKEVLRTSWDGRVVIQPEKLLGVKKISVRCKGFEDQKLKIESVQEPLLVSLVPAKRKAGKGDKEEGPIHTLGTARSGVMYKTMLSASPVMAEPDMLATADYATMEEAMPILPIGAAIVNDATAGTLTAGEVNDFAKWGLWPGIIDDSHKAFAASWRIQPRHRYTVQVTNKNGYPFASRAVTLEDLNGNTLYQAVTDNTGKAELWYQLISNGLCGKHGTLRIRVEDQVQDAKDWYEGLNTFVLDEPCEEGKGVDVMFVFDATGSMGDELRYLQEEMKDVIRRATDATGGLAIRTGAVVYRDHGDEYLTRLSRLTDDLNTTQTFIDKQEANGGGDYPEAMPEALMATINSSGWDEQARARIAFLILDAPCHEDSATIALLHDQILNAAAMGVRIVPVVCSGMGESGEYLVRSIALATNGISFFLTDDSGIGHSHLKPTTDSLKVEHLNDMMVRTIVEFSTMPSCAGHWTEQDESDEPVFIPNPFETSDLTDAELTEKDSPTTLYLVDISGKLITIYEGRLEDASDSQIGRLHLPMLSTGVYFVKAFYDGKWHTKKILIH
ncbi:MAG: T9SS type A sorting domain-containing protein [Paludibacteraceae bacterium]|nr:T9SS type A sorting domain-containing protein [Paludibacteraceae bacterium]